MKWETTHLHNVGRGGRESSCITYNMVRDVAIGVLLCVCMIFFDAVFV